MLTRDKSMGRRIPGTGLDQLSIVPENEQRLSGPRPTDAPGEPKRSSSNGGNRRRHGRQSMDMAGGPQQAEGSHTGWQRILSALQETGKTLVDLGKLQAHWISKTLTQRVEAQDFMSAGEQGLAGLVARHVYLPAEVWQKFLVRAGASDGHFWRSAMAARLASLTGHAGARAHKLLHQQPQGKDTDAAKDIGAGALPAGGDAEDGKANVPVLENPRRSIFGLYVLDPYNDFAVLWSLSVLLLDVIYTAFWVPMNVAFCTASYGDISKGCTQSDLIGGAIYTLNVILGFLIGVVATHGYRKQVVKDGPTVAWLYFRYGRFWLDFVSSVPFIYLVIVIAGRSAFNLDKSWVNALSLIRLIRMLRLLHITKIVYMDSLSGRFQDSAIAKVLSVSVIYSLFLAYMLAVAINLLACIMIMCAYFEGYDNSWMTAVSWVDTPNANAVFQWYAAVYWMIVTATTTGFGDYAPRATAEQVFANVAMIGGMLLFGVLVAIIGNALARATADAQKMYGTRRKITHIKEWAESRSLPQDLRKAVQNFYTDKFAHKEEDFVDGQVMRELPSHLRNKVARSLCGPLVADVHILLELPMDLQVLISENLVPLRLPAGEDLCQQGDTADCLWILQEGTVQAVRYREGSVNIDAIETPALLGETVLLGDVVEACRVRPWTLRTVSPSRLWRLPLVDLLPMMRMYPQLGSMAAEYIKFKTVYGYNGDRTDEHWCELAAAFLNLLQNRLPGEQATPLVADLFKATSDDDSLLRILEHLLALCTAKNVAEAREAAERRSISRSVSRSISRRTTIDGGLATTSVGIAGGGGGGLLSPSAGGPTGLPDGAPGRTLVPLTSPFKALATMSVGGMSDGSAGPAPAAAAAGPGGLTSLLSMMRPNNNNNNLNTTSMGLGLSPAASSSVPALPPIALPPAASTALPAAASGGALGAAVVECPGCHRHVCPSCGQGTDLTAAAAAAAAAIAAQGVNPRPAAPPVNVREWANKNNVGRMSMSNRADAVWSMSRMSFERKQDQALNNYLGLNQGQSSQMGDA